jgi:hypothetical protein
VETLEGSAGKNLSRDEPGSKFQIKFQSEFRTLSFIAKRNLSARNSKPKFDGLNPRSGERLAQGNGSAWNRLSNRLLGLREQHEHPRAALGDELILLFLRANRNRETIAVAIVRWLTVHKNHVMMRLVSGDVVNGCVPRVSGAVALQSNFLPIGE